MAMSKKARLRVEEAARTAVGEQLNCTPRRTTLQLANDGPKHEFDIYSIGKVIGGVSTSSLHTSGGKTNTGGCDRALAELLWLSLWAGTEHRIHVLTNRRLAEWLVRRFTGLAFAREVTVYHYNHRTGRLSSVGTL